MLIEEVDRENDLSEKALAVTEERLKSLMKVAGFLFRTYEETDEQMLRIRCLSAIELCKEKMLSFEK